MKVPTEAVGEAKTVKAAVPVLSGIRVIGDAMNRLTPTGAVPTHDADNVIAAPNPFMEFTVRVAELLPPCVTTTFEVDVSEKSGKATVELVLLVVVCMISGTATDNVAETTSSLGLPIAVTT